MAERPSLAEVLNIIGMNDPKHLPYFGPILVEKLTALYAQYSKPTNLPCPDEIVPEADEDGLLSESAIWATEQETIKDPVWSELAGRNNDDSFLYGIRAQLKKQQALDRQNQGPSLEEVLAELDKFRSFERWPWVHDQLETAFTALFALRGENART